MENKRDFDITKVDMGIRKASRLHLINLNERPVSIPRPSSQPRINSPRKSGNFNVG